MKIYSYSFYFSSSPLAHPFNLQILASLYMIHVCNAYIECNEWNYVAAGGVIRHVTSTSFSNTTDKRFLLETITREAKIQNI